MKQILIIFTWMIMSQFFLFATELTQGKKLVEFPLSDQHGHDYNLLDTEKYLLISYDMKLSKKWHVYLSENPDFLTQNKISYITDITPMPKLITQLFAGPKMKKYPFKILLVDNDRFSSLFKNYEGKFSLFKIGDDKIILEEYFPANINEIVQYITKQNQESN